MLEYYGQDGQDPGSVDVAALTQPSPTPVRRCGCHHGHGHHYQRGLAVVGMMALVGGAIYLVYRLVSRSREPSPLPLTPV